MIDIHRNALKRALARGDNCFGLWLALADAYAAEVCAAAPFDWWLIDGEHAPFDLRSILATLQVLAAYQGSPVVRLPVGDPTLIKQVLDLGAQSLMIPNVEDPEHARALVAATRYPPHGIRGVGAGLARASRWNARKGYLQEADQNILVIAQIESQNAIRRLDELAAIEGLDVFFIGPADLAASMGFLGNSQHPTVQQVIADAMARLISKKRVCGILATDYESAQTYLRWGARLVAVGSDTGLLAKATRQLAQCFIANAGNDAARPPANTE
jgi:4-hydroxy-2-oxoheptanedioate aldolase